MAVTPEDCSRLVDGEGLRTLANGDYLVPVIKFNHRAAVILPLIGIFGSHVAYVVTDLDGRLLRVATLGYASCPPDSAHLLPLLRLLGELNLSLSGIKFGWDPGSGQVEASVEAVVEEGELSQAQFHAMVSLFLPRLDVSYYRICHVIETGRDRGEVTSGDLLELLAQCDSLPSALRWDLDWVLEDLQSGKRGTQTGQEGVGN
ncbi:MAG: hypothetical protein JW990_06910 [Thermoleophilia bacterium]|nr:hypothetical protein [Thermoleophilia bacterium]